MTTKENFVHIVYQQDAAAKAKPVDWYLGLETPYVHIGTPVYPYNMLDRETIFHQGRSQERKRRA